MRRGDKARLDRDGRKALALHESTEIEYCTCPLCGRKQPLKSFMLQVKPDYAVVTVRKEGAGGVHRHQFRKEDSLLQV